jgi:hypothetical protein
MPAPGFFDFNNFDPDFDPHAASEVDHEPTTLVEFETNNDSSSSNNNSNSNNPSHNSTPFRPVVLPGGKGRGNTTATGKAKVLHRDPSP